MAVAVTIDCTSAAIHIGAGSSAPASTEASSISSTKAVAAVT